MRAAFAPRFAVSCSRELLEAVAALSAEQQVIVHTHASENRGRSRTRSAAVRRHDNLEYLADTGLATQRLCTAHCVWVTDAEQALLAERDVKVLHCPGSNLKLGSGIAPIAEMRARGISVSLGADGAACNNRLDMFDEMRLAATLQAVRQRPGALTARDALWMATRGRRARARAGRARSDPSSREARRPDPRGPRPARTSRRIRTPGRRWSTRARGTDVRLTMVDGEVLVRDFGWRACDPGQIGRVGAAARTLTGRVGLS